jgi:AbrB family looped-hinge helix DNA binding protein
VTGAVDAALAIPATIGGPMPFGKALGGQSTMGRVKERSRVIRPPRRGQITIPAEFRRELGISDETPLRLTLREGELRLRPVGSDEPAKGSLWLRELWEYFEPVRREADERGYMDEQINEWIDEALAAYRRD